MPGGPQARTSHTCQHCSPGREMGAKKGEEAKQAPDKRHMTLEGERRAKEREAGTEADFRVSKEEKRAE